MNIKKHFTTRIVSLLLGLALVASFASYELAKPNAVQAAVMTPSSPALDESSVSALLAFDKAMETVAARVTPAVVNVAVTSRPKATTSAEGGEDMQRFFGQFFGGRPPQAGPQIERGIGSGVIISPDGYIVTNDHVVKDAVDIRVTMTDRRILNAKLIGTDPLTDLAVIKVEGTNLPSAPWGDSTELHPGQTVLAFGNPFGLRFTVTRGIVSALNRPNPDSSDPRKPGEFIQTDAAINQGNSGGPLVDARGQVIGINTFLISPSGSFSGMGFAIPSQIVKPTAETLIRYGKVSHGYIGVGINDVTPENAKFFHLNDSTGALITQVEPDSPGAKAGIKVGDVVTQVDGQKVTDAGQLQVVVGQKRPGTTIALGIMRDGKSVSAQVTLEEVGKRAGKDSPESSEEHGKLRWGIGLTDLTPDLRGQLQASDNLHGAVVANVEPGSAADNAGLGRGDVILEVNRQPVQTAADVKKALGSVPQGQDALVLVWSNGGSSFRVLHSGDAS